MITLAFYRGRGRLFDVLISLWTRSDYSHVEILERHPWPSGVAMAWSSSPRDGGVRGKAISFDPDKWDLVQVPWAPSDATGHIALRAGAKYDWLGIFLSQILPLNRHSRSRWFCSEICAEALGFPEPHSFSPAGLRAEVMQRNTKIPTTKCKPAGSRSSLTRGTGAR